LRKGASNNKLFKKFIASTISSFRDKNVNIGKVFIPNSARRVNLEKYLVLTYKFVEVIYFKTRSASIIKYADFLETIKKNILSIPIFSKAEVKLYVDNFNTSSSKNKIDPKINSKIKANKQVKAKKHIPSIIKWCGS